MLLDPLLSLVNPSKEIKRPVSYICCAPDGFNHLYSTLWVLNFFLIHMFVLDVLSVPPTDIHAGLIGI